MLQLDPEIKSHELACSLHSLLQHHNTHNKYVTGKHPGFFCWLHEAKNTVKTHIYLCDNIVEGINFSQIIHFAVKITSHTLQTYLTGGGKLMAFNDKLRNTPTGC